MTLSGITATTRFYNLQEKTSYIKLPSVILPRLNTTLRLRSWSLQPTTKEAATNAYKEPAGRIGIMQLYTRGCCDSTAGSALTA